MTTKGIIVTLSIVIVVFVAEKAGLIEFSKCDNGFKVEYHV